MPSPTVFVTAASSVIGANAQKKASRNATAAQTASAEAGIAEQRRQFDAMRELLAPYVEAGTGALDGQQSLIGLNGPEAQQEAIDAIENGSQFNTLVENGENAILQNASATGGIRGGNTQSSLAQFRPSILNQLIEQQYTKLGGLSSQGQNAAAGVGNAGLRTGDNISGLHQSIGSAQASGALAQGKIQSQMFGNVAGAIAGGSSFGGNVPVQFADGSGDPWANLRF